MVTHSSMLAGRILWTERSLEGYSPLGRKESDTAERLNNNCFLTQRPCINVSYAQHRILGQMRLCFGDHPGPCRTAISLLPADASGTSAPSPVSTTENISDSDHFPPGRQTHLCLRITALYKSRGVVSRPSWFPGLPIPTSEVERGQS